MSIYAPRSALFLHPILPRSLADGYYGWVSARADIDVNAARSDGTADVAMGSLLGTLRDGSAFSGYQGTLGASPRQVSVTRFLGTSSFRTTTLSTAAKVTYPDGSWSQTTTVSEFQSNRICGLGRR